MVEVYQYGKPLYRKVVYYGMRQTEMSNKTQIRTRVMKRVLSENGGMMRVSELGEACHQEHGTISVLRWKRVARKIARDDKDFDYEYGVISLISDSGTTQAEKEQPVTFERPKAKSQTFDKASQIPGTRMVNGVPVRMNLDDDHIPEGTPELVVTDEIKQIYDALNVHFEAGIPVAFKGPKGVGKTVAVNRWCEENQIPLVEVSCHHGKKSRDLDGTWNDRGGWTEFEAGPIPKAYELANKYGRCIIDFEEVNALSEGVQKDVNPLLDWRKGWTVDSLDKTWKLEGDAKILVVATMNPETYGGTTRLNEDFESRWVTYEIGYPNNEQEKEIMAELFKDYSEHIDMAEDLVNLAETTRAAANSSKLSYALSPRDVKKLMLVYIAANQQLGDREAKKMVYHAFMSHYPEDEHETAKMKFVDFVGVRF